MRILITGGTGFIGRHLIQALLNKQEVFLLSRREVKIQGIPDENIFVFNDNIPSLKNFINQNKIQGVIHLAAYYVAEHKAEDLKNLILSNILLGTSILEAIVNTEVKWFINIGTIWQNYNVRPYSDEYNPVNLYAATKQAFLTIAKYYEETTDIKFVTLKLCDTYGEGDTRRKIINLFWENAKSGNLLEMSEGEQLIDIVHVQTVIKGINKLIEKISSEPDSLKSEYVITSGRQISLRELALDFENKNKVKLNIKWGARNYRKREVMKPYKGYNILAL